MFLWVSRTPLGEPVDPLVYMMQNKSSPVGRSPRSASDLTGFDSPRALSSLTEIKRPPRSFKTRLIASTTAYRAISGQSREYLIKVTKH